MLGVTYFFLGRIYFGHVVLGRNRQRERQPDEPQNEDGANNRNLLLFYNLFQFSCFKNVLLTKSNMFAFPNLIRLHFGGFGTVTLRLVVTGEA